MKTASVPKVAASTTRIETGCRGSEAIPGTSADALRALSAGARLTGVGKAITEEARKCPMCGSASWILLDGASTLKALEGGMEAVAYSCDNCGFMRWHRLDKVDA